MARNWPPKRKPPEFGTTLPPHPQPRWNSHSWGNFGLWTDKWSYLAPSALLSAFYGPVRIFAHDCGAGRTGYLIGDTSLYNALGMRPSQWTVVSAEDATQPNAGADYRSPFKRRFVRPVNKGPCPPTYAPPAPLATLDFNGAKQANRTKVQNVLGTLT